MNIFVLALILSPVFLILALSRHQRRVSAERSRTVEVVADASGVHRTLADERREEVEWQEITRVEVFTTRIGPHKDAGGAVVLFGDEERGCIVPLDRLADSGLLDHVSGRLPGFVLGKLIEATLHGEHHERDAQANPITYFKPKPLQTTSVVWRREPDPDDPEPDEP